jgi:hypothetical protein
MDRQAVAEVLPSRSRRIADRERARPAGFEPATGGLEVHCSIR